MIVSLLKNACSQANQHQKREYSKTFYPYRLLEVGTELPPYQVSHRSLEKVKEKHRLTEDALDDIEAFKEFLETIDQLDERKIAEKYEFNERRDSLHYYARVVGP
jgi:hypothetical protein